MVDFVLDAAGEETIRLQILLLGALVLIGHADFLRAFDIDEDFRQRQAALVHHHQLVRRPGDRRVDHAMGLLLLTFAGDIDDDQATVAADLRRGQADAGRVVHGRQHVLEQCPHAVIDLIDRFASGLQPAVGRKHDRQHCHSFWFL